MKRRVAAMLAARKLSKSAFTKQALNPEDWAKIPKDMLLLAAAAMAAAGVGVGYVGAKASESTQTDMDNAKNSYAVGNLKSSIAEHTMKLKQDREQQNVELEQGPQKTMRML